MKNSARMQQKITGGAQSDRLTFVTVHPCVLEDISPFGAAQEGFIKHLGRSSYEKSKQK